MLQGGDHDAIAGSGGLALLEDHLAVGVGAGGDVAVGDEGDACAAHGNGSVREALLVLEVADELAAATLVDAVVGKVDAGGLEGGVDVSGGGLFAYDEDLSLGTGKYWREEG